MWDTERLWTLEGRQMFTEGHVGARRATIKRGTCGIVQCNAAAFGRQKGRLQAIGRTGHLGRRRISGVRSFFKQSSANPVQMTKYYYGVW